MIFGWRIRKYGAHTVVSLTVEAHGRRWQLDRAVESRLLKDTHFRSNYYTMMIDDLSRNLGRVLIAQPKEPDDHS